MVPGVAPVRARSELLFSAGTSGEDPAPIPEQMLLQAGLFLPDSRLAQKTHQSVLVKLENCFSSLLTHSLLPQSPTRTLTGAWEALRSRNLAES
jgi:hypothetical protein